MSKDLMSDNKQPPAEPGTATNIMTRNDMRKTIVKVVFEKKYTKLPDLRPRRWEFATTVLANEFIQTIMPPPGAQLGSPKQWKAKIARLLGLSDLSIINKYDFRCELQVTGPAGAGDDTGMVELDDVDTFVEGAVEDTPEPVTDEDILAAAAESPTVEFPE